ncbi:MAG: DUF58 domain-containing protein [Gammaproteobacteria bacterium]|nr:DUF58 domain-containing protein [Gammaproteobacteria bacterium]
MRWWMLAKILLHPIRFLQERIDAWVMARVKRQPGPIAVPRHRVYIVPTRFGYAFAFMVFVMLLGAMNYSNSMAFALVFLLTGLGLVCMHHTHANLVNVQLRALRVRPVFAGETAHFELLVENPSRRPRYSLGVSWPREPHAHSHADVAPRDQGVVTLSRPAPARGWLPARVFSVFTEFPLGMFHAWTWIELDMACLVYPKPAPPGPPPPAARGHGSALAGAHAGQDEFAGLRNYQRGDTPRSIHWKSLPKLRQPMVKQFTETLEQELWLDWDALPQIDAEARLSQLTRWVLDAEAGQRPYGLRLPGLRIAPGRGEPHQESCLKALALFDPA